MPAVVKFGDAKYAGTGPGNHHELGQDDQGDAKTKGGMVGPYQGHHHQKVEDQQQGEREQEIPAEQPVKRESGAFRTFGGVFQWHVMRDQS